MSSLTIRPSYTPSSDTLLSAAERLAKGEVTSRA